MTARIATALLALFVAFVGCEVALRAGGAWLQASSDRSSATAEGHAAGSFRILCVGDSNTYGLYVERDESYPAQLERAFAALGPARPIEVVNLGVPGSNSAQLLNRLPTYLDRFQPDLLIVLIGVTDHWNPAEQDPAAQDEAPGPPPETAASPESQSASTASSWREWLWRSRVLRVVALAIENLRYREPLPDAAESPDTAESPVAVEWDDENFGPTTLRHGELSVDYRHGMRGHSAGSERHVELVQRSLAGIIAVAREHHVPLVVPTYAADVWHYATANRAILGSQADHIVRATFKPELTRRDPLLLELSIEEQFFQPSQHPTARVYRVYAEHLRDALLREGLVDVEFARAPAVPAAPAP